MSVPDAKPGTLKRSLVLLPAQVFARGLEALLPVALAAWFGTSAGTDGYWASYSLFLLVLALVVGAFQDSALVPVLTELLETDLDLHRRTTRALVGSAALLGTAVGALFLVTGALYFTFAAPEETRAAFAGAWGLSSGFALWPFALLAPAIALRSLFAGMHQARGALQVAPICAGLGAIVQLGLLFGLKGTLGISVAPLAQLGAECTYAGAMALVISKDRRFDLAPSFRRTEPSKRIFRLVASQVLGAAVTRANPIVDQSFALRTRIAGGVTAMRYAVDVATAPTMLLEATLFQVVFIDLTRAATRREFAAFMRIVHKGLVQVASALAATSAVLFVLRRQVISLVFAHGHMGGDGIRLLTDLLPWALLDAIPFASLILLVRANVSLQNTRIMLPLGVVNVLLNAAFNALLLPRVGLGGLLAATGATQGLVAVLLYVSLQGAIRSKIQSGVLVDK